jgi:peptidoglycan/xylan/chitin deacetylase (PgdA/CDA1 family)
MSENYSGAGFPADFEHRSEKGWMRRRKRPSYNATMRAAQLVLTSLAAGSMLLACGEKEHVDGPVAGAAGMAGTGGDAGMAGTAGTAGAAGASLCSSAGPEPALIGTDLGDLGVESITTWKNDAQGAYTIIHDDACDYTLDSLFKVADPELTGRSLKAAFGAIVERCQERNSWANLEILRQHGHEIINHSWSHKDIVAEAAMAPLSVEIDQANMVLDQNLKDQHTSFFIFPYDSFDDAAVAHVGSLGYLGARAGKKGVNTPNFPDGLRVMFDVWGGEDSIYNGQGDILKIYVDLAISEGGWSVREFHGIADLSYNPMTVDGYRQHLDYVRSKVDAGQLWVDTPSTVLRYRFARQYCAAPVACDSRLVFPAPSDDCKKYATPLTVVFTTSVDVRGVIAQQDGQVLIASKLGPNRFMVDLNPAGGQVSIGGAN